MAAHSGLRARSGLNWALTLLVALPATAAPAARPRARAPQRSQVAAPAPGRASSPRLALAAPPSPARPGRQLSAAARGGCPSDPEKAALEIPGLKSREDVDAVVTTLEGLKGVRSAILDLNTHLGVVDYFPDQVALPRLLAACRDAGYEANEYRVEDRFPKPIKLKGG